MKRNFVLTLVALSVFSISAHAQKRRSPARSTPAQQESQAAPSSQNGQVVRETICKGLPIPAGYVTAGETADSSCAQGAWILKRRGTRLLPGTDESSQQGAWTEGRRVTLNEVTTDLVNYLQRPLTVEGYLALSSSYYGPYYQKELTHYAFSLSDDSGASANVYVPRGEELATKMRALLLSARGGSGRAHGKFTFIISELYHGDLSGGIYAELISAAPADR